MLWIIVPLPNVPCAQQDLHRPPTQLRVLAERGHVYRRLAVARRQGDGAGFEAEQHVDELTRAIRDGVVQWCEPPFL